MELALDQDRANFGPPLVVPDFYSVNGFIRFNFEGRVGKKDVLSSGSDLDFILMVGDKVEVTVMTAYFKAL